MTETWRVCLTDIDEAYLRARKWLEAGYWVRVHRDEGEGHWVVERRDAGAEE